MKERINTFDKIPASPKRTMFRFDSKDLEKMTMVQKMEALNDLEEVKKLLKFSIKLDKFSDFI